MLTESCWNLSIQTKRSNLIIFRSIYLTQKIGLNFCLLPWNHSFKPVLAYNKPYFCLNMIFYQMGEIFFRGPPPSLESIFQIFSKFPHIYYVWRMEKTLRIISIMINSVFTRVAHRLLTDQLNNSVTQYPKCSFTR